MTMIPDRSPIPPPQNRKGVNGGFHLTLASAGGEVNLNAATCGFSPPAVTTWVITADAAFSVTVETPKAELFVAPPGVTNPVTLNTMAIVKGRWPSLKITTTGQVNVAAYTDPVQLF